MSTKHSPLRKLQKEADGIAKNLKSLSRGENTTFDPKGKIQSALKTDQIRFGVVMDDKVLDITMTWATIRELSETMIASLILDHMRESRDTKH